MRSIKKISLFASFLLLCPTLAGAAGLGKLSVQSGLGQALKAEVEVVAVQAGEADSLTARVASPDAFRQAGVDYSGVMPQVRTNVVKRGDRYVVTLITPQPVEEPYLDVLLELNSASGRLVRQYTFLLDPVGYKAPESGIAPPVVVTPKAEAVRPESKAVEAKPLPAPEAASTPAPKPAPSVAKPQPVPAASAVAKPATPAADAQAGGEKTYRVKQGDTLAEIAAANKPADVSLGQMLVAIQRTNEDAFINKNINLVRSGRILHIPDAATVAEVKPDEATRIVNTQGREFNEYRATLARQVAGAPTASETTAQRAAGRITTAPEEKPAGETPKDQVRLSRADEGKAGSGAAKGPSADDIAAREKALREANERVAALERNVKDLQTVVELKNKQLADLQKQAEQATVAAAAAKSATSSAKTPEAAKAPEPVKPPEVATTPEPAKVESPVAVAPEPAFPVVPTPATPEVTPPVTPETTQPPVAEQTPIAPTPEAQPEVQPVPPVANTPAEEPTVFESLTQNPLALAGIAAVIAALVGLMVWRRKQNAGLNNSLIGATTTDSSSVFGTTGGRSIDTGSHSMQTDFSHSALGSIDTDEVDPIAEADVYMAYGRDAQAEEILKEALQKDPSRQAVRVKLLEIYAGRKDLKAFEMTAGEIHAATGGIGPDWDKAAALGRGIDPDNTMYGAGDPATAVGTGVTTVAPLPMAFAAEPVIDQPAELSEPILDLDLGKGDASTTPDLELDDEPSEGDVALDLNLGDDAPKEQDETVDFSPSGTFIMDAATQKAVSDMAAQAPASPSDGPTIDFELPDNDAPMQSPQPMSNTSVIDLDFEVDEPRDVPALDLGGLNLDLDSDGADSHWQEVATKLDLAKAYEEMGDKEGARELLGEVLKEGDSSQQEQARTLLETMR